MISRDDVISKTKKVNFSIDTRNFKLMFIHILKSNSYYYNNGNN